MAQLRKKSVIFARQKPDRPAVMLDSPPEAGHFPSSFPPSLQAIVTTARGVYSWSRDGAKEIFHSGSGGIVAAKKTCGAGGLLAVADSQVVVLHDVKKGMQQSYRLKGTEVRKPSRRTNHVAFPDYLINRAISVCLDT